MKQNLVDSDDGQLQKTQYAVFTKYSLKKVSIINVVESVGMDQVMPIVNNILVLLNGKRDETAT